MEDEERVRREGLPEDALPFLRLKQRGFSDARLAELRGMTEEAVAAHRRALGVKPVHVLKSDFDLLVEVESASAIRSARPDFRQLAELEYRGVIITSESDDPRFDFLSRFFGPAVGVDEDPVTGSEHYLPSRIEQAQYTVKRKRRGATANIEFRPDHASQYFLRGIYTEFIEVEPRW